MTAAWSFESIETTWPEMVTGPPPALSTCPLGRVMTLFGAEPIELERATAPAVDARASVTPLTTTLSVPTDMVCPFIVATAPGAKVEDPMTTPPFETLTMEEPPRRAGDDAVGLARATAPAVDARASVTPFKTMLEAPTEMVCPLIVATAPGPRVELPTMTPPFEARRMEESPMRAGEAGLPVERTAPAVEARASVCPFMTTLEAPTDIVWPLMVAWAPGFRVEDPTTMPPFEARWMEEPPTSTGEAL